jgi:hypothetical protein
MPGQHKHPFLQPRQWVSRSMGFRIQQLWLRLDNLISMLRSYRPSRLVCAGRSNDPTRESELSQLGAEAVAPAPAPAPGATPVDVSSGCNNNGGKQEKMQVGVTSTHQGVWALALIAAASAAPNCTAVSCARPAYPRQTPAARGSFSLPSTRTGSTPLLMSLSKSSGSAGEGAAQSS